MRFDLARAVDEEHVRVGSEADLGTAVAPHPDHGELDRGVGGSEHVAADRGEQRRDRHVRDRRERRGDVLDRERAGHRSDRRAQQFSATHRADPLCRIGDLRAPSHDRARLVIEHLEGSRAQLLAAVEPRDRLRDPLHEVPDIARPAQQHRERFRRARRVAEHPEEPGAVAEALADAPVGDETAVRVDPLGEPPQHHRHERALHGRLAAHALRERADVCEGTARILESDGREPVVRLGSR